MHYIQLVIRYFLRHNFDFLAKCWKKGDITSTELTDKSNTYTAEECQYHCKKDSKCLYFTFHKATNSCKLFDDKTTNSFVQDSPTLYGPKNCQGNQPL